MKKFKIIFAILIIIFISFGTYFYLNKNKKENKNIIVEKNEVINDKEEIKEENTKILDFESSIEVIKKRAGIAKNLEGIEIELNKKDFILAGNTDENLDFWIQNLNEDDKKADEFIIIPKVGLVMPILSVSEENKDYQDFIHGKNIDMNKYFQKGAFLIPGTSINNFGEKGNKVISGHSSYYKNDKGRYKTHFQKIIELEKDDEIWIYQKNKNGEFDLFKYIIRQYYNTDDNDINILKPSSKKLLSLFTCTPIGGLTGRWVIRAEFIEK